MRSITQKLAVRTVASALLVVFLAGCSSAPQAPPVDQRAPGKDITPEARADKRDAPVTSTTGAQTSDGK